MKQSNSVATVIQALRMEMARLSPGDRLPSVRALMARLRVSPVTVRRAMAQLAREGALDARPGHGTFVPARPTTAVTSGDFAWQGLTLGPARVSAEALEGMLAPPPSGAVNLAGGYPEESLQAVGLATQAMTRAARRATTWGRMPIEGLETLRAWFAQGLGAPVTAHEVLITPGSQPGIAAAFGALTAPGDSVLVESPTYLGAIVAARAAGLRLVPVPTDRDGVQPELLTRAFAATGARLFYAQPTLANPTGASLVMDRRAAVLEAVTRAGAFLVEDDWCRDLAFESSPPPPLLSEDRNGHVVYLRSLTKASAPGLRIGAIVARGAALTRLRATRAISDFFVPGPIQEATLELVHSPGWPRHLRSLGATLRSRRDVLVEALRHHVGRECLPLVPAGGLHVWLRLPDAVDDVALAARAAEAGVLVSPGRRWFPAEPTGSFLRLSFSGAPEARLEPAVATLARLILGRRNRERSRR